MSIRDILKTDCNAQEGIAKLRHRGPGSAAHAAEHGAIVSPVAAVVHSSRLSVVLPWPPSVNDYLGRRVAISRSGPNSHLHCPVCRAGLTGLVVPYKTTKAKEFESAVVGRLHGCHNLTGRLSVTITTHQPTKRARDLDNLGKCILDALTAAGAWDDDSQIDRLEFRRGDVIKGGCIEVEAISLREAAECAY